MWIQKKNGYKYMQERIYDELTGKERILSARIKIDSPAGEKDAEIRLNMKIAKVQNTAHKLFDIIGRYLEDEERLVKSSTYRKNESILSSIKEILGDVYLDKITAGYVREQLVKSNKPIHTCNQYIKTFKSFMKWAYRNDYTKNYEVSEKLTLFMDKSIPSEIKDKFLETEEVEEVLDYMSDTRYRLATRFLVLSGLRIGEFIALNTFDVNKATISVRKTYDIATGDITSPKTICSNREVHVQPELWETIQDIRRFMIQDKQLNGYPANEYFMCSSTGNRISYKDYATYLKKCVYAVTGKEITPHALRHTHTSLLAEKGVDISVISRRLGHEHSSVTENIYLHVTENQKKQDNEIMDNVRLMG